MQLAFGSWVAHIARAAVVALTLGPVLVACGTLTGIDDYVADCATSPCDAAAPSVSADAPSGSADAARDAGVVCRATPGAVVPKCTAAELAAENETAPSSPRLILVPNGDQEAPYQPNCMTIKVGQSVTWRGKLSAHPLIPREESTIDTPIQTVVSGTEAKFQFDCPGDFNFSCRNHADMMLGTIHVVP